MARLGALFVSILLLNAACGGTAGATPSPIASPSTTRAATAAVTPLQTATSAASPSASLAPSPAASAFASSSRLTIKPIGTVDGAPLGYLEYLPPGSDAGTPAPLLVYFHSSDASGDGTEAALRELLRAGPMAPITIVSPIRR